MVIIQWGIQKFEGNWGSKETPGKKNNGFSFLSDVCCEIKLFLLGKFQLQQI